MSEIRTSEQIAEIAAALAKAQAEMENVAKDRENPHFRAKYATLAGVLDEVRPKLAKHGIAIWQMPVNGEGSNIGVVTRFTHLSGQWIESALYVAPTKFDAQGAGSVISYCRRYALMAMAGVGQEDDDGNAAVGRPDQRAKSNGNGHAYRPGTAERERVWTEPEKPQPPHNPETGEVLPPHALPSTEPLNPVAWGQTFIAAIKATKTQDEIDAWVAQNGGLLGQIEANYSKAWRSIDGAIAMQRAKIGPDPLNDPLPF